MCVCVCVGQYLFVCLFICVRSDVNMTMCALDTRKTKAREILMQSLMSFCNSTLSSFSFYHSLCTLLLDIPDLKKDCFNLFPDGCCLPHYIKSDCATEWISLKGHFNQNTTPIDE